MKPIVESTCSWQNKQTRHTRVKLVFESGKVSYFNDMRNFGTVHIKNNNDLVKKLKYSLAFSFAPFSFILLPFYFLSFLKRIISELN